MFGLPTDYGNKSQITQLQREKDKREKRQTGT